MVLPAGRAGLGSSPPKIDGIVFFRASSAIMWSIDPERRAGRPAGARCMIVDQPRRPRGFPSSSSGFVYVRADVGGARAITSAGISG